MADKLTAILIGGTGATGKEVLKELNATDLISKIIFISRRALEFPDQPKVRNLIKVLYRYRSLKNLYQSTAHFQIPYFSLIG